STLAAVAMVLLAGLLSRELGGGRIAQLVAAACWAGSGLVLVSSHLLSTTTFDLLFAMVLSWLLLCWLNGGHDRLWLAMGAVLGFGLWNKYTLVLVAVGLLGGIAVAGPREALRTIWPYAGAAVALLIWLPNLIWQAANDWPQLDMAAEISDQGEFGGRAGALPYQLILVGPPIAAILIAGLVRLLHTPDADARRYRCLGWAYLIVLGLVLLTGGKPYYASGLAPVLLAAGGVAVEGWLARGRSPTGRSALVIEAIAVNLAASIAIALPVWPLSWLPNTPQAVANYDALETVGWPELVRAVAEVRDTLPDGRSATILTGNYGEAGAIDRFGGGYGLPTAYSGHNAYWTWGPPPDSATGPVIVVGYRRLERLQSWCDEVEPVRRIDTPHGIENDEDGAVIWVCSGVRRPWSAIWPELAVLG
ncbi:MAG TPA: glycosyltransferase family 39 protein, partial [Actinomycetes bacterium]|nr:glycosyltransferase family 39 protein [Actinomycetes bacterium]